PADDEARRRAERRAREQVRTAGVREAAADFGKANRNDRDEQGAQHERHDAVNVGEREQLGRQTQDPGTDGDIDHQRHEVPATDAAEDVVLIARVRHRRIVARYASSMRSLLLALIAVPLLGNAQDDANYRLMKLEQDVRNLERQVQTLTRQIDELKQQSARAGDRGALGARSSTAATTSSTAWIEAARWDRVRTGMSELEVINILGPPTS